MLSAEHRTEHRILKAPPLLHTQAGSRSGMIRAQQAASRLCPHSSRHGVRRMFNVVVNVEVGPQSCSEVLTCNRTDLIMQQTDLCKAQNRPNSKIRLETDQDSMLVFLSTRRRRISHGIINVKLSGENDRRLLTIAQH